MKVFWGIQHSQWDPDEGCHCFEHVYYRDGKKEGKYSIWPVAGSPNLFNDRNKLSQMVVVIHNMAIEEMIVKHVFIFESEGTESSSTSRRIVSCCIATVLEDGTVCGHHAGNVVWFLETKDEGVEFNVPLMHCIVPTA